MIGIKKIEVWLEVFNIRIMIGQIRFEFFMIEDNLEYLLEEDTEETKCIISKIICEKGKFWPIKSK